jgi:hypothetical protein
VTDFLELIESVHDALERASVPHALGGALALSQIAEPRATVDIDLNVFLSTAEVSRVDAVLSAWGYEPPTHPGIPVAGMRFVSTEEPFPIDVFPSLHERYSEVEARCVHRPIRPDGPLLPFLSAIDLCVFKLSFDRPKDRLDLGEIAKAVPDLDVDAVEDLLVGLRGNTMHPRIARFRARFDRPDG